MLWPDIITILQYQDLLDYMLELPDIAGPGIGHHHVHGLLGESINLIIALMAVFVKKILHEQGDIFRALTKRWDMDGHDINAIIEIIAKGASLNGLGQVVIGGGKNANIQLLSFLAAYSPELPLLDHPEELGLGLQREVAYLIKEKGPLVCQLK
jgi:hypothetical protein